jgi:hypothetical protein
MMLNGVRYPRNLLSHLLEADFLWASEVPPFPKHTAGRGGASV